MATSVQPERARPPGAQRRPSTIDFQRQPSTRTDDGLAGVEQPRDRRAARPLHLPAPDAGSQSRTEASSAAYSAVRKIGGIGDQRVETAGPQRLARDRRGRARSAAPISRRFSSAKRERLGREIDADHPIVAALGGEAERDASAPGADVGHPPARHARQHQLDQPLGLGPRDQRAPVGAERQMPEARPSGHVRQRLARGPPPNGPDIGSRAVRRDRRSLADDGLGERLPGDFGPDAVAPRAAAVASPAALSTAAASAISEPRDITASDAHPAPAGSPRAAPRPGDRDLRR